MDPTEPVGNTRNRSIMRTRLLAIPALAALAAAGCGGASDSKDASSGSAAGGAGKQQLSLVAYSTPEVVYDQVIPQFQKTEAGSGVSFKTSYGASGDQSRAVEAGQKADVVTFSLEPDLDRLVKAGLASDSAAGKWVSTSVVSFIVRKGNPKNIKTWDDLVKPGIEVVTPNVFSSGGAKWNLLAAYGAQINEGKSPTQALAFLKTLLEHAVVQPGSAGDALTAFTSGKGDVLLSYESDAI